MKTRCASLALALLLAVGVCVVGVITSPAVHAAAPQADASGAIFGAIVNGTHGKAPVAGQSVTLEVSVNGGKTQTVTTATTDASGHFRFTGLDASGDSVYALDTRFQGGDFTSGAITFGSSGSGPAQQANLTVYDTTSSDAALSVSVTTVLFSDPDKKAGLIPIGEFVGFKNTGTTAFVGSTAPANGLPMGLLRFSLPDGATNLTVGQGFENTQVIQVGSGFGATATVPPGSTQFAFTFDVPYTGTDYLFHYKAEYATAQVVTLVPTDMLTDARDFTAKPPVDALGQKYQLLEADNVKSGAQLSTRVWDLPLPGEQPDLDFRLLVALASGLTLLLALLLGLYVKRGNLAVAFGLLPAEAVAPIASSEPALTREQREAERKRLLKALLALDRRHTAGEVDDRRYESRRAELRGKLKALLLAEGEQPADVEPASTPETAATSEAAPSSESAAQPERPRSVQTRKRQTVGGRR